MSASENSTNKELPKYVPSYRESFPTKLPVDSLEDDDWMERDLNRWYDGQ